MEDHVEDVLPKVPSTGQRKVSCLRRTVDLTSSDLVSSTGSLRSEILERPATQIPDAVLWTGDTSCSPVLPREEEVR